MNEFDNLLDIVSQLRKDCPWDKEQTHESLLPYLLEETYEVIESIELEDWKTLNLSERLGGYPGIQAELNQSMIGLKTAMHLQH